MMETKALGKRARRQKEAMEKAVRAEFVLLWDAGIVVVEG